MRVGQYCYPRYLYLFPYFSSTMHVRIEGNDSEDKMATTIYCLCGIGTAQQIFMKHSNIRKSSASRSCNKVSKSSSQQQPPRANVFQLAKKSTNNKLSPTAASLHHRQPSISSFANLLPQIAAKSSCFFQLQSQLDQKILEITSSNLT